MREGRAARHETIDGGKAYEIVGKLIPGAHPQVLIPRVPAQG